MDNKTHLNKVFNDHKPCVIFPNGLEDESSLVFVIAEGFIVRDGIFWFNTSWNYPLSGTGMAHHTKGKIKGPMISLPYKYGNWKGYKRYWQVGDAWLFEIEKGIVIDGIDYYDIAMKAKARSKKYKDDQYKSRLGAARIASRWMRDLS